MDDRAYWPARRIYGYGSATSTGEVKRLKAKSSPNNRYARRKQRYPAAPRSRRQRIWGRKSRLANSRRKQRGRKVRSARSQKSMFKTSAAIVSKVQLQAAVEAGFRDASSMAETELPSLPALKRRMRALFCEYYQAVLGGEKRYKAVKQLGAAYRSGFASGYPQPIPQLVLLPSKKRMAIVLCAFNEQEGIKTVLAELERLVVDDVIVIINGSTDSTYEAVRSGSSDVTTIYYPYKLGHDVGRAIGAKVARADAILFADSDFAVSAEELGAFLWAVEQGVDVALNDLRPFMGRFDQQDNISHCKRWLNTILERGDLNVNSMTAIPHALSRRAIETIGVQQLSVPPKAHAIALLRGLNVQSVQAVDVIKHNRVRDTNVGQDNLVSQLILGDHMEAIHAIWEHKGDSLHEPQQVRSRIATRRNSS
ncbi:glycosyltransferase family 2 protein [Paenibacillus marinisediminis]